MERGFSLIELLFVIMLAAVVSIITLPKYNTIITRYELKVTAGQIAADLRLVQQMAVSKDKTYRIIWDVENRNCYFISDATKILRKVTLPKGIKIDYTSFRNNTTKILPSGAPEPAGSIAITSLDKKNKVYIIVSVATGRVRISENAP